MLMETSVWFPLVFFLVILVVTDTALCNAVPVQAMFVFGDSLIDPGNNNNLKSLASANYLPHGIDFSEGPTGRFCNGGTMADHLSILLGLGLIPAFTNPSTKGSNVLRGVNFASSAAGLLNDTGAPFGDRLSMDRQIVGFREIILPQFKRNIGRETTTEGYLAKSLFFSNMGSNDFLTNYILPTSYEPKLYSVPAYQDHLTQVYTRQLKELYNLGARKFLITGIPPFGCIPFAIVLLNLKDDQCVSKLNDMAMHLNSKVKTMVQQLNKELSGASFLFWDLNNIMTEIIDNPSRYGFKYTNIACCGAGRLNSILLCTEDVPFVCPDRSEYVFWDPFHPSDAFNAIVSEQAYGGKLQDTYPMNVKQLLQL
ncbi:hypothetical protein GIB67_043181 [Kingdonia uniflora]|uniref:Uncharacterized protein n=1 Tax=Kingdonia uniflora TaxID=39325 RepID=A0A7J7NK01_9MAGN|nr:hypothetical protein GIB67_043181 [Kingdonia uniflora]